MAEPWELDSSFTGLENGLEIELESELWQRKESDNMQHGSYGCIGGKVAVGPAAYVGFCESSSETNSVKRIQGAVKSVSGNPA